MRREVAYFNFLSRKNQQTLKNPSFALGLLKKQGQKADVSSSAESLGESGLMVMC
jgi:hypothetical protein